MLNAPIKQIGTLAALITFTLLAQPVLAQDDSGSKHNGESATVNTGTPGIDNDSAREATSGSDEDSKDEESDKQKAKADDGGGNTLSDEALAALRDMGGAPDKKDDAAMKAMARGRTGADEDSLDIGDVDTSDQKNNTTEADLGEYSEYEVFESAIVARSHQIENCFAEHVDAQASGQAVVRFRISGTGEVKGAGVINAESINEKVTRCIVDTVQNWHFPAPRSGQASTYSHPFTFGSK